MTNFFQKAKPIYLKNKSHEMNTYAVFSAELDDIKGAVLYITACSFYRLTVNGKFAAFGPARTAKNHARVDAIALSEFAASGKNHIVIEMTGYYCKSLSTVFQPSFFCAEVRIADQILAASGYDFAAFAPTCKLQRVERYSRQRHFTEIWDMRNFKALTDEQYRAETEILNLDLTMLARTAPYPLYEDIILSETKLGGTLTFDETRPYKKEKYSRGYLPQGWGFWRYDEIELHPHTWIQRQKQTISKGKHDFPVTIQKDEYIVLDFEHIEVGFFLASIRACCESELILAFSEYYEGDIFELPNMNAHNVIELFLDETSQKDFMSFEPYTCRYAIIAVKEGKIQLDSFGIKTFMFDIKNIEYPDFGDKAVNDIYRAAVRTFAHNAVDLYTDCPSRERAGWLCDSYFTAKVEYALTGKTAVEDAFLENFLSYQQDEKLHPGVLPMCYPADAETDTEDSRGRFIPQWTMWYILESADYLLRRGHADQKEAFRESIEALLGFYRQYENSDGLLERLPGWNFVEWSVANDWTEDVNYPTNFLYAGVLDAIADIYGDETCRRRADEVRKETIRQSFHGTYFHDHAVRDESGTLILQKDASEACQYYAILFGELDLKDKTYQPLYHLVTEVFSPNRNGQMPEIFEVNAFIGAYLRIETLLKLKEYPLLLRDIKDFFGNMEQYTGTLWEYRQYKGSQDHGFASYTLVAIQEALKHIKA